MRRAVRRSAFVALTTLAIAMLLGIALLSDRENRKGEEFSAREREWLMREVPRGRFTSPSTFRACVGGVFVYYYSDEGYTVSNLMCWTHNVPTPLPSFLPTRP